MSLLAWTAAAAIPAGLAAAVVAVAFGADPERLDDLHDVWPEEEL